MMLGKETERPLNYVIYLSIHTAWNDSFKLSMILILRTLCILFYFALPAKWLFSKTTCFLGLRKIFWMPTLPTKWLESQNIDAWQLVCSQDVIDTNENFCFLGLSKKLPPVLLQIEVCFVEQVSQKVKINNLFINIESWNTFFKLVGNYTFKKTVFSRLWRNIVVPCDRGTFFWLFLFVSSSLLCVVSWSATWIFTSNLKTLTLPGLLVSSISLGAINSVSK